ALAPVRGGGEDGVGDGGDARDQQLEVLGGAALGLDHRELEGDVGELGEEVDEAAQVGEVLPGDDAVDGEVEAAAAEVAQGGEGLVEGVAAHEAVVHGGAAAVQREVDVAQARGEELVDELAVGEGAAVGDEAEVEAEVGDAGGPAE